MANESLSPPLTGRQSLNIKRLLKKTSAVQVASAVTTVIGGIVDAAVTGTCLGVDAIAAFGLVLPIVTIFTGISNVGGSGLSILCGRSIGEGNLKKTNEIVSSGFTSSIILSVIMLLIVCLGASPIAAAFGTSGSLHREATGYIFAFGFSAPAVVLTIELLPVMQIDGDRSRAFIAILVMMLVNVAGDFLNGLVLHKGLFGMGMATTISYYASLAVLLLHFTGKNRIIHLRLCRPNLSYVKNILIYGAPNALQHICRSFQVVFMNRLIISISSSDMIAVYTSITSAGNLCMTLGTGIGQSTSIITGVFSGEKDLSSIKALLACSIRYAAISGIALIAVMVPAAPVFMPVFLRNGGSLTAYSISGFRIFCCGIIFYGINVVLRNFYQAMHITKLAYPYVLFDNLICSVCCGFILTRFVGITGVWLAYPVGELVTLLIFVAITYIITNNRSSILDCLMCVPVDFLEGIEASWEYSAVSVNDLIQISQSVERHCLEAGADSRVARGMALSVEEIGTNIVQHGFIDGKSHVIELRLIKKQGSYILRVRDDCPAFSPVQYMDAYNYDDQNSGIGLRLISGLADKMEYTNTMHLNNLRIEINN